MPKCQNGKQQPGRCWVHTFGDLFKFIAKCFYATSPCNKLSYVSFLTKPCDITFSHKPCLRLVCCGTILPVTIACLINHASVPQWTWPAAPTLRPPTAVCRTRRWRLVRAPSGWRSWCSWCRRWPSGWPPSYSVSTGESAATENIGLLNYRGFGSLHYSADAKRLTKYAVPHCLKTLIFQPLDGVSSNRLTGRLYRIARSW